MYLLTITHSTCFTKDMVSCETEAAKNLYIVIFSIKQQLKILQLSSHVRVTFTNKRPWLNKKYKKNGMEKILSLIYIYQVCRMCTLYKYLPFPYKINNKSIALCVFSLSSKHNKVQVYIPYKHIHSPHSRNNQTVPTYTCVGQSHSTTDPYIQPIIIYPQFFFFFADARSYERTHDTTTYIVKLLTLIACGACRVMYPHAQDGRRGCVVVAFTFPAIHLLDAEWENNNLS